MRGRRTTIFMFLIVGLPILIVVSIAAAAWRTGALPIGDLWHRILSSSASSNASESLLPGKLVGDKKETLELPQDVLRSIGVETAEVEIAHKPRQLHLDGSILPDLNRLSRVHARFPGEVVELGRFEEVAEGTLKTVSRLLRFGDRVSKGQVLAVLWNADLGTKKNDLIDALSSLKASKKQYERGQELYKKIAITDAQLEAYRRNLEGDENRVAAVERTLRTLRITEEEIKAIKVEAERILTPEGKRDPTKTVANWARVEVMSPIDGIIAEKNFILGDIVDTSLDLFRIADLDKVSVMAHVYEEDLPALQSLKPEELRWTVHLQSDPKNILKPTKIDVIGPTIDVNQHTALAMGELDNPRHLLHPGQFITATVDLPPNPEEEVFIPATALIEDGRDSVVIIKLDPKTLPEADPKKDYFEQRRVVVTRREQQEIYIRSEITRAQEQKGLRPLKPGDVVVKEGAIILQATMEDLSTDTKKS